MKPLVYLVDDDPFSLLPMRILTEKLGWECRAFESAQELLDAIEEHDHALVLSDLRMPEINGLELFSRLRERGIDYPFYLISGHANQQVVEEALALGVTGFLSKPLTKEQLRSFLEATLPG